jgi:hypothetical protein
MSYITSSLFYIHQAPSMFPSILNWTLQDTRYYSCFTLSRSQVQGDWLSWQKLFMVFLSPSSQIYYNSIHHHHDYSKSSYYFQFAIVAGTGPLNRLRKKQSSCQTKVCALIGWGTTAHNWTKQNHQQNNIICRKLCRTNLQTILSPLLSGCSSKSSREKMRKLS